MSKISLNNLAINDIVEVSPYYIGSVLVEYGGLGSITSINYEKKTVLVDFLESSRESDIDISRIISYEVSLIDSDHEDTEIVDLSTRSEKSPLSPSLDSSQTSFSTANQASETTSMTISSFLTSSPKSLPSKIAEDDVYHSQSKKEKQSAKNEEKIKYSLSIPSQKKMENEAYVASQKASFDENISSTTLMTKKKSKEASRSRKMSK